MNGKLKADLSERYDYEIVCEKVAKRLYKWFGGGVMIKRTVVGTGRNLVVDIYPFTVTIHRSDTKAKMEFEISARSKICDFTRAVCAQLGLDVQQVKFWDYYQNKPYAALDSDSVQTLNDVRILDKNDVGFNNQFLFYEYNNFSCFLLIR